MTAASSALAADHHNGIIAVSRNLGCDGGGGGGGKANNCADEFVTPLLPPCGGKESTSSMSSSLQVRTQCNCTIRQISQLSGRT